ncbi:hypothetical protein JMJ77_0008013 [Colletotrichum scovillei]|uniref:Uncharacterized protein n=1 Tax=Colletotrichum scovillei TaxID=1209932 RepID=A0A9P7RF61_9PEZI|nr:hypothetical protein JMJ77_0008013 [Colletotrichum scovillei]KAG7074991.1 hypothetical protein JMJ76_0011456 [Colletotrichum scovillei]KAG7082205.1 hypothetical protein JMJ78_0004309 [Colletotrichum scovillei]
MRSCPPYTRRVCPSASRDVRWRGLTATTIHDPPKALAHREASRLRCIPKLL